MEIKGTTLETASLANKKLADELAAVSSAEDFKEMPEPLQDLMLLVLSAATTAVVSAKMLGDILTHIQKDMEGTH